jgi:hypothetical protein
MSKVLAFDSVMYNIALIQIFSLKFWKKSALCNITESRVSAHSAEWHCAVMHSAESTQVNKVGLAKFSDLLTS